MIKTKKYRALCGILFSVMLVISLAACGSHNSSNEGGNVISKDKTSLKIKNTKSIDIYDVVSSDSNNNVHITDPEIINQIENLFNKTSFIKCTTQAPIQARNLYIMFSNDSSSISLFVYANDIMDIDGTKYKSEDITFDAINTFYLKWQRPKS